MGKGGPKPPFPAFGKGKLLARQRSIAGLGPTKAPIQAHHRLKKHNPHRRAILWATVSVGLTHGLNLSSIGDYMLTFNGNAALRFFLPFWYWIVW